MHGSNSPKSRSFSANPGQNIYPCFLCGSSGHQLALACEIETANRQEEPVLSCVQASVYPQILVRRPFFCTDPNASVQEILEAFADRATIEQDFHDVKEVWGSGQQQVRNIWTNLAVYNLNLWMHTLVELWAWDKSHDELCDRSDSPWDDAHRRPSHANRRNALRRHILRNELLSITAVWSLPQKIIRLANSLMPLAT